MKSSLLSAAAFIALTSAAHSSTVTAFCPCVRCTGQWSGGPTASGIMPRAGITVAAPRSIPFGTRVRIGDLGVFVVQDRLAKRYDNRFDVFMESHATARAFGKRSLKVTVLP